MTGKDLFEGMSWVDEGFVDEAEHEQLPKPRVIPWIRIASMAACLCLILFAIPHLLPLPENPRSPEDTAPHGSLEDPQESQNSNILAPEDPPTGEIPNVILYVEEMTAEGFIGTVTDYGVTDHLGLGRRLNVVIGDGMRSNADIEDNAIANDSKTDFTGRYVVFQFYDYDPETGTIVIDSYGIIDEEG